MKIFAWADSPTAPTGFGRSTKHVLEALHEAGYQITQLAVNHDPATTGRIPWKIIAPSDRAGDPYGLGDLRAALASDRFDIVWTTFDPEVPWRYAVPGKTNPTTDALTAVLELRNSNPAMRFAGWFPVDGGPLSDYELNVLGLTDIVDAPVTMSPHVYDLIEWTLRLRNRIPAGSKFDRAGIEKRLEVIPHGVDLERYRIPTDEERAEAKRELGFEPDDFVILQVERNQQRKQNYLAHSMLERLRKMRPQGIDPSKIKLFQHCIPDEENTGCRVGFNLPDLAWRYGLEPHVDVRWPAGFLSDDDLVRIVYGGADAFVSLSTGEGFQYPAFEALACGVPLVVPDADARRAWFGNKGAPNAHLFDARADSIVMRGGYGRRMALPDPSSAASVLKKMIEGRKKFATTPELRAAGRDWVYRHCDVTAVKGAWVAKIDGLAAELREQRRKMRIVVGDEPRGGTHVRMVNNPGFGDLIMTAPALQALRKAGPVTLEVQRSHLDLAAVLGLADLFTTPPGAKPNADRFVDLTGLYSPKRVPEWTDVTRPRFEVIAEWCGVDPAELEPFETELPSALLQQTEQRFCDTFGVSPRTCVGLAFQSGSPHRELPAALYRAIHPILKELNAVPVVLGDRAMNIQHVGVIDLTGKLGLMDLLGVIGNLSAVIAADSSILHMAGALGVPTVGCYSLFSPESRWCYRADHEAIVPTHAVGGETFPAGVYTKAKPGDWTSHVTASRIEAALRAVLGLDPPEAPAVILPPVEGE